MIWKNNIKGGRKIDFPAFTSDYLPTILDVLELDYPDTRPLDGVSILKAIQGEETIRQKPMGFICKPHTSWVTHQYKLIGNEDLQSFELYDLLKDPSEKNNVIDVFPEVAHTLEAELVEWHRSVQNSKSGLDY